MAARVHDTMLRNTCVSKDSSANSGKQYRVNLSPSTDSLKIDQSVDITIANGSGTAAGEF